MRVLNRVIPIMVLSLMSYHVQAEIYQPYIGVGVGSTTLNDSGLLDDMADASKLPLEWDTTGLTYRVYAGYHQNQFTGLEISYAKYGSSEVKISGAAMGYSWSPRSFAASANLGFTSNSGIRPFVLLGLSVVDFNESEEKIKNSGSGMGLHYGVGVEYAPAVDKGVSFRVAYEGDMASMSVGGPNGKDYGIFLGSLYCSVLYRF